MFGYGSDNVNGQLVPMRTSDGYAPRSYGPTTMSAPGAVNTVPPMMGVAGAGVGGSVASATAGVSGGLEGQLATAAAARPFDMAVSPVPIAILSLVVALVWLRAIHWG